jgi:hypothetical protein
VTLEPIQSSVYFAVCLAEVEESSAADAAARDQLLHVVDHINIRQADRTVSLACGSRGTVYIDADLSDGIQKLETLTSACNTCSKKGQRPT